MQGTLIEYLGEYNKPLADSQKEALQTIDPNMIISTVPVEGAYIRILNQHPEDIHQYLDENKYIIEVLHPLKLKLSENWYECLSPVNEIWTSCLAKKNAILNVVPGKTINLFPQAYEVSIDNVQKEELSSSKGFVFYTVWDWDGVYTENLNPALTAFLTEFSDEDDVTFVIRVFASETTITEGVKEEILSYLKSLKKYHTRSSAHIVVQIVQGSTLGLHRAGNAYISTKKAGAWDIEVIKASKFVNPVISPRAGGVQQWLTGKRMHKVLHKVDARGDVYVDIPNLRLKMREVYEKWSLFSDKTKYKLKAYDARKLCNTVFSKEYVGRQMVSRIKEIIDERAKSKDLAE